MWKSPGRESGMGLLSLGAQLTLCKSLHGSVTPISELQKESLSHLPTQGLLEVTL